MTYTHLSNADSKLNMGAHDAATAYALTGILSLLLEMKTQDSLDKAEREREGRDGIWEVEWFVEVPGRPPFKFPSEEEACAGARHASETVPPDQVKVYWTELKRYARTEVPIADWQSHVS